MAFQGSGTGRFYARKTKVTTDPKPGRASCRAVAENRKIMAMALLASGKSAPEVAKSIGVSVGSIHSYKKDIRYDEDLRSKMQAIFSVGLKKAEAVLVKSIEAQEKGIDLYMKYAGTEEGLKVGAPQLREVTGVFHRMSERFYPQADAPEPVAKTSLNINLKDPKQIAEVLMAMRGEPTRGPDARVIDVTPIQENKEQ